MLIFVKTFSLKKAMSILMALIVLLSTVHLTVAAHFCSGQLAEFNIGLDGTSLGCAMDHEKDATSFPQINKKCCDNYSQVLKVDKYQYSFAKHLIFKIELLSFYSLSIIPVLKNSSPLLSFFTIHKNGPPIKLLPLSERLASICAYLK